MVRLDHLREMGITTWCRMFPRIRSDIRSPRVIHIGCDRSGSGRDTTPKN